MNNKERVEKYINDFGSITTKQAFIDLGITRLSEYIRQIRLSKVVFDEWVTGKNRWGEKTEYKKYYFEKKEVK